MSALRCKTAEKKRNTTETHGITLKDHSLLFREFPWFFRGGFELIIFKKSKEGPDGI
jgi:hypothetical protein